MLHPRVREGAARRRAVGELLARHDGRSRRPFASAAPGTVPELISQTKRITNRGQILSATLASRRESCGWGAGGASTAAALREQMADAADATAICYGVECACGTSADADHTPCCRSCSRIGWSDRGFCLL